MVKKHWYLLMTKHMSLDEVLFNGWQDIMLNSIQQLNTLGFPNILGHRIRLWRVFLGI